MSAVQKKERGMLFSAPMVRALLDGSKTQTRRAGKSQCRDWSGLGIEYSNHATRGLQAVATFDAFPGVGTARHGICACPYGVPGDRLWVRETHWRDDEDGAILYAANPCDFSVVKQNKLETGSPRYNWTPSLFMRRVASRITLEITGVRVERLQDISEADCWLEGAVKKHPRPPSFYPAGGVDGLGYLSPIGAFAKLWESINGPGSWAANPWVWCVEFKRVES